MAGEISSLGAITGANTADGDLFELVDVSDTTLAPSGTNKRITRAELRNAIGDTSAIWFGDGSDGNVTISGTVTLTRDMFYDNLTVPAGQTVDVRNYRIFVRNTLDLAGTIHCDGMAGEPNGGWGSIPGAGFYNANGGAQGANGVSGTTGSNASWPGSTVRLGGAGGAGGAGASGAGGSGASGGNTLDQHIGGAQGWRNLFALLYGRKAGECLGGGGGGGQGGSDGGLASGGGAGAGVCVVVARRVTGSGVVRAAGGAGGTSTTGNRGGGGGGGGGVAVLATGSTSTTITASAAGGAGGNPSGTGAAGSAGSVGRTLILTGI